MTILSFYVLICIAGPDPIDVVKGTLEEGILEYYYQTRTVPRAVVDLERQGFLSLKGLDEQYEINAVRFDRAPAPAHGPFWSFSVSFRHRRRALHTVLLVPVCEPAYLWRVRYKSARDKDELELVDTVENQAHFIADAVDWDLPGKKLPERVRDILRPGQWTYDVFSKLKRQHQFELKVTRKREMGHSLTLRHIATGKTYSYDLPKPDRGFSFVHVNGKVPWRTK